jgi:hypothetical protein
VTGGGAAAARPSVASNERVGKNIGRIGGGVWIVWRKRCWSVWEGWTVWSR